VVRDEELYNAINTRELFQVNGLVQNAKFFAFSQQLIQLMDKYDWQKGITFHSSNKAARDFIRLVGELARTQGRKLSAKTVNGEMNAKQRHEVLRTLSPDFKSRALVGNCQVLTEGINVPNLDFVSFVDPKNSKVGVVQALSRALRKVEGKEFGYVLVPVFVPEGELPEQAALKDRFAPVVKVLNLLAQEDEAMYDEINAMRIRLGAERPTNIVGGRLIVEEFQAGVPVDRSFFENAICEHVVDRLLSSNFSLVDEVRDFAERNNGRAPGRAEGCSREEFLLCGRLCCLMNRWNSTDLSLQNYAMDKLGPYPWFRAGKSKASHNVDKLLNWKEVNGRWPIVGERDEDGFAVGAFLNRCRTGQSEEAATILDALCKHWRLTDTERGWQEACNYIKTYRQIPISNILHNGVKVGELVKGARYGKCQGLIVLLDEICQEVFNNKDVWRYSPREFEALINIEATLAWIDVHGKYPAYRDCDESGVPVGRFMSKAREQAKLGATSAQVKAFNEAYNDDWLLPVKDRKGPRASQTETGKFEAQLNAIFSFIQEHGWPRADAFSDGFKVGQLFHTAKRFRNDGVPMNKLLAAALDKKYGRSWRVGKAGEFPVQELSVS
jgi:hypothetical protein